MVSNSQGGPCQRGRAATELAPGSALLAPGLEARPCGDEAALLHPQGPFGLRTRPVVAGASTSKYPRSARRYVLMPLCSG